MTPHKSELDELLEQLLNPEYDDRYNEAMLKAKEVQKTIIPDEDAGEWNLL